MSSTRTAHSRDLAVAIERRLDVHGDPVDEALLDELLEPPRKRAVRVELDQEPALPDDPDQVLEVLAEQGLAARHAHPFEPALPRVEIGQEEVHRQDGEGLRPQDEVGVVAERTAERAAAQEDRRGDVAREVPARELL